LCVYNTESVHVIVQGFSYRYELCVCIIGNVWLPVQVSVLQARTLTHTRPRVCTHMYFGRVLVPFFQETCVIMDCASQGTA